MIGRTAGRLAATLVLLMMGSAVFIGEVHAEAGLQLIPLKYEDRLVSGTVKNGFVDVANPNDTTVAIETSVQGFRQADLDGNLAFFQDSTLTAGIIPGLSTFNLGPRESIRVTFTVDPDKLPKGGVYAAIFFRTLPPPATSDSSFINESANVGTLLLLQNGNSDVHVGAVTQFSAPFWQFGSGLSAQIQYQNTNRSVDAIAFSPSLVSRVYPWGRATNTTGPLVLPGSTRRFGLDRPGSYFGLIPISLTDQATGAVTTRWVIASTGWYSTLGLIIGFWLTAEIIWYLVRRRRRPRTHMPLRRPMDGISPIKKP